MLTFFTIISYEKGDAISIYIFPYQYSDTRVQRDIIYSTDQYNNYTGIAICFVMVFDNFNLNEISLIN